MLVVLHLLSLFLLVGVGFYVFVADPRRRANQTFAAFIAFLAAWTVKDLIFWNFYPRESTAGWWASASFVIALLMQYAMVVFAWVFPENARTPRSKAAILFAPGLVFIPAALSGMLWRRAEFTDSGLVMELTPTAYAFGVYIYFLFGYAAYILFRKYRIHRGTQAGQQVGAILFALATTGGLMTLATIGLPFVGDYEFVPYSAILLLPGVVIFAYAIFNFRLFSFQTALDQFRLFPITYKIAISIAAVAVVSFLVLQIPIAWWAFRNGMDYESWRRYLVFSVLSALVPNLFLLLLVLRTISRPLQRITLAAIEVSKGGYGHQVDLRKSNDEIGLLAESVNQMSRKMASDIQELHRLNEQLIRSEKLAAMGTLAAGVAHEVNNPLASISSLIQMMRSEQGHSSETREKLALISDQIQRISQVTTDMTDFARVRPSVRTLADLNLIARTALRLASFDDVFKALDVETDLASGLPPISADEDQLEQVVLNILLNARDAMTAGGTLLIRTSANDDNAVIEITDSGKGLAEREAEYIFDPFYTTKPPGKGTGLGLAVCYGIVTAHGGRIEVSENAPAGTRFMVHLPIAKLPDLSDDQGPPATESLFE